MIDVLFNLVLMIFWTRLTPRRGLPSAYYNPYIARINQVYRFATSKVGAVAPGLAQPVAAGTLFGLLIVLRGLAAPRVSGRAWRVTFGFVTAPSPAGLLAGILLSAASFAVVLFYFQTAHTLLSRYARYRDDMAECLDFLTHPLGRRRPARQWAALALLGLALSAVLIVMSAAGGHAAVMQAGFAWRALLNTAAALLNFMPILQSLLLAAIIGSWIGMLAPSEELAFFCRDAIDFMLGPLRSFRLAIGPLDLTPLLFLFLLGAVHGAALRLLQPVYLAALN